jgi:hypothetical protein
VRIYYMVEKTKDQISEYIYELCDFDAKTNSQAEVRLISPSYIEFLINDKKHSFFWYWDGVSIILDRKDVDSHIFVRPNCRTHPRYCDRPLNEHDLYVAVFSKLEDADYFLRSEKGFNI